MHTERLVGALNAHGHINPTLYDRVLVVLLLEFRVRRLITDHGLELGWFSANHWDELRQAVGIAVGNIQHPGHILEHSLRRHPVERDDLRHFFLAVTARDVIDHLAPAFNAEVCVDIRHRLAFRVQEALKQQAITHRVDIGDSKGVSHQRASSRAAAWTDRNPLISRETDVIPHHKEVGRKSHLLHDLKFMGETIGIGLIDRVVAGQSKPVTQTLLSHFA